MALLLAHLVFLVFFLRSKIANFSENINEVSLADLIATFSDKLIHSVQACIVEVVALSREALRPDTLHSPKHTIDVQRVDQLRSH